jgi:hypothetical protein
MDSNLAAPGEPVSAVAASSADREPVSLYDDGATEEKA